MGRLVAMNRSGEPLPEERFPRSGSGFDLPKDKSASLTETEKTSDNREHVELRNPLKAAGLALLWPGLGHLYQRRYAKGILFMICILPTYFFGWSIGGGKVVYAWQGGVPLTSQRFHYVAQVWIGLPAWPAMIQSTFGNPLGDDFMAPPRLPQGAGDGGGKADWQQEYHRYFELGTVYTMIAGILNLLVIFDAAGGPIGAAVEEEDDSDKQKKAGSDADGQA